MAAWQRCMARSETTLASKMSVFGHEQESVEVVVRDLAVDCWDEIWGLRSLGIGCAMPVDALKFNHK